MVSWKPKDGVKEVTVLIIFTQCPVQMKGLLAIREQILATLETCMTSRLSRAYIWK